MKPKFGIVLPNGFGGTSQVSLSAVAREAEDLGYESVSSVDWICNSGTKFQEIKSDESIYHYETISLFSFLAGQTKKLKFRYWSMVPPPRNPIVLAKQLSTLDNLSNGRLIVSFGVGSAETFLPYAEKCYHVPFHTRAKLVEEYAQALREIWDKGRASFAGKYINFEGAVIFPRPYQKNIPIYMAARTERALDRVAKYGDGWSCNAETPEWVKEHRELLNKKLLQYGRNKEHFPMMHGVRAWIGKTKEAANDHCKEFIDRYPAAHAPTYGRTASALDSSLIGTADDAVAKVEQFSKAGVDVFLLSFVYGYGQSTYRDVIENMAVFRDKVVSAYR